MGPQASDDTMVRVGLTSEFLVREPKGPERGRVILSAHDAAQMLDSFQDLVYFAAAYRTNKSSTLELTRQERQQFKLVISGAETNSFIFKLKPFNDNDAPIVSETVTRTLEWISTVTSGIGIARGSRRHTSGTVGSPAEDYTTDILDVLAAAAPILGAPHPDPRALISFGLVAMAKLYKVAVSNNHALTIEHKQTDFKPSYEDMSSVIEAEKLTSIENSRTPISEERPFPLMAGRVTDVEPEQDAMYIQFTGYAESIKCGYESDGNILRRLKPGDRISITGRAVYRRGAPHGARPEFVHIDDFGDISHQYGSLFRN